MHQLKYLAQGLTAEKMTHLGVEHREAGSRNFRGLLHYNASLFTQQILSKYFSHYNHSSFEARCVQSALALRKDRVCSQAIKS